MESTSNNNIDVTIADTVQLPRDRSRALDWGIEFAWLHFSKLLSLAVVPTIVQIFSAYLLFTHNLLRQQKLLVLVLSSVASVWLLTAISMYAFETVLRAGKRVNLAEILQRALRELPKVLLSYVAVVMVVTVGLGSIIIPGLVFLAFLLWAPAFCVGEIYAISREQKQRRSNLRTADDEPEELDPEELFRRKMRAFFSHMSIWELGLMRSARFTALYMPSAVLMALILLAAVLIPSALVGYLNPYAWSFVGEVLSILVSALLGCFAMGVWVWTFLLLMPREARREIGVDPGQDFNQLAGLTKAKPFSLEGNIPIIAGIVLLSALSGYYMLREVKEKTTMPASVQTEILASEVVGSDFVVRAKLIDVSDKFRWLLPYNFRLTLAADKDKADKSAEPEALKPDRIDLFDAEGRVLSLDSFSPSSTPLVIALFFDIPTNQAPAGEYQLGYTAFDAPARVIGAGSYKLPFAAPVVSTAASTDTTTKKN